MPTSKPADEGTTRALLVAWAAAATLDAGMIALVAEGPGAGAGWHHLLAFGHVVVLAAITAALVRLGAGLSGARAFATLFVAAFVVDAALLTEELTPRAGRLAASMGGSKAPWLVALCLVFAATIPLGVALARRLRSSMLRFVVMAMALMGLGANHLVLARGYPGAHLHVALLGVAVLAASMKGMRWPRGARVVGAMLLALGIFTVLAPAPQTARIRGLASPGTVLLPYVARAHAWWATRDTASVAAVEEADVPPGPPLIASPVVVWISIDALRADVLADESHRAQLPNLFALRDAGVWFTRARTPAPATHVALASMFTGQWFSSLRWSEGPEGSAFLYPHRDPSPRLPALLRGQAEVHVFHGSMWFEPKWGIVGDVTSHHLEPEAPYRRHHFTRASRLVDAAVRHLEERTAEQLLFMHLMEAHAPYDLAPGDTDEDRYLGELALIDAALGPLRESLAEHERAIVIVSADHGEAFGEHATKYHATTLYEELVRVPLLIVLPAREGTVVDEPVSLMDLAPTLLDLFGVTTPGAMAGESLVPHLRGEAPEHQRPIAMDSGRLMRAMVFDDGMKLIEDRRRGVVELYDLRRDPDEKHNLSDELQAETEARLVVMRRYFAARAYRAEGYATPFRPP